MSLEQAVLENLRVLPPDKQQEVLDFAQFLRQKTAKPLAQQSLKGLWTGVHITEEDIDEARREMWTGFPREVV